MDKLSDVFKCTCMTQNISSGSDAVFVAQLLASVQESVSGKDPKGFGRGSYVNFHIYADETQGKNNSNLICHVAINDDVVTIKECNPSKDLIGSDKYFKDLQAYLTNTLNLVPNNSTFTYDLRLDPDKDKLEKTMKYIKGM